MSARGNGRGETLIRFEDAALGYGGRTVLDHVDATVERGDFLGVIGPNGSGKTTMLRCMLGSMRPLSGRVRVAEGLRFGYVIQRQALDTLFPLTAVAVAEMGRNARLGPGRRPGRADGEIVERSLEIVGMSALGGTLFRELSGGQKQRVLLARALASEPDILLLDEPTNDLDVSGETRIMDLIHEIHHSRGITVVIVSHLLHVVLNHVDRMMFIMNGAVRIHTIEEVLSRGFLSGLYGVDIQVNVVNGKRCIVMG